MAGVALGVYVAYIYIQLTKISAQITYFVIIYLSLYDSTVIHAVKMNTVIKEL